MTKLRWIAGLIAACAAAAGCVPRVDVSLAANVPSQYSHVWLTVRELWFNTSATATPEDTTWTKLPLTKTVTVDLASLTNAALGRIATDLDLPAGTYRQIRLLPVDEAIALTSSASRAGAKFNSEADFTDSTGRAYQVPLELLNPEKGIGVQTSIRLKDSSSASGSRPPAASVALVIDGMHDLVQFRYGTQIGVLLNPHAAAYDVSAAGTIRGTIDLSDIGTSIGASGQVNVSVTAESVSSDNTRHTAVTTAPVAPDGTFVLYPLATDATTPTSYDLVIHGPGIATVIIKSVPAGVGDPTATTVTSVGTVTTRPATSFALNLKAGVRTVPPGALIGFYQTLPQPAELPYLIAETPLDPFSGTFFADYPLSRETIDFGTYVSGGNVVLTTVAPVQGAGVYILSAQSPLFEDGALTSTVAPPSGGTGTTLATVGSLKPISGSVSSTLTLQLLASTVGKYDHGELLVSHDGGIIQTLILDSALIQSGGATLVIDGLPGGGAADLDYLSVRAWNSRDPAGTLQRQSIVTPADLRSGSTAGLVVLVN